VATLVFSYSHADEDLRNKLEVHLAGLKRLGHIEAWHDRRILAGQEFANEIDRKFAMADIILLLVSPDFIASDYCYNLEMQGALQRHAIGEAIVIPIILRPCDWHELPFGKLQAGTTDGKPIVHFPTLDDGFLQVVQAIKKAIKSKTDKLKHIESPQASTPHNSILQDAALHNELDRSSNLRVKRSFTDKDKDQARIDAYEYVAGYFENSLQELKERNQGVDVEFKRIDSNSFEAAVYLDGKRVSKCGIWIGGIAMGGDIFFSNSGVSRNSYNESMSLTNDGYSLGFKPLGMSFRGSDGKMLGNEGVAEYFWEMFISPLQR